MLNLVIFGLIICIIPSIRAMETNTTVVEIQTKHDIWYYYEPKAQEVLALSGTISRMSSNGTRRAQLNLLDVNFDLESMFDLAQNPLALEQIPITFFELLTIIERAALLDMRALWNVGLVKLSKDLLTNKNLEDLNQGNLGQFLRRLRLSFDNTYDYTLHHRDGSYVSFRELLNGLLASIITTKYPQYQGYELTHYHSIFQIKEMLTIASTFRRAAANDGCVFQQKFADQI